MELLSIDFEIPENVKTSETLKRKVRKEEQRSKRSTKRILLRFMRECMQGVLYCKTNCKSYFVVDSQHDFDVDLPRETLYVHCTHCGTSIRCTTAYQGSREDFVKEKGWMPYY
jgi:hypothetical protein